MVRPRSPGSAPLWGVAGKAGYAVCCVASAAVLMTSGAAYYTVKDISAIGGSDVITGTPSIGAQNILLMGLESRTDWDGNVLPPDVLSALHAGSTQGVENGVGGNATNTLILIHIPAGGGKAIGFSIPRDDYVTYPQSYLVDGVTESGGKIDDAYGYAMAQEENKLLNANGGKMTNAIAFQGNEAGRAATIATVEQLTGVPVDHFAEVNLDGFYELAKAFGGVEVCLNHPVVYDSYSGFYAHHAGLQHLDASMALAFVRQRHGLTNGDLDRTRRQQAVIDSVIHQMKTQGILSDLSAIESLLSTAKQYVITDAGWDLLDFATQMRSLTAKNLVFETLPITGYATIGGQDDNTIDVQAIQQEIHNAFYPPAAAPSPSSSGKEDSSQPKATPSSTTVDVYNGGETPGLAANVSAALVQAGYIAGTVGNAAARTTTEVLYGTGVEGSADAIATDFGVTAQSSPSVAAGQVEVMLGSDATTVPTSITAPATSSSGSASNSSSPAGPDTSALASTDGIPCVD
jgi:LCP family protein required for cell wall assembly